MYLICKDVDNLSPSERSEIMSRVRSKNSRAEICVRKLIFALGYRYRLHARELPGRPDIVFRRLRRVIFVHGWAPERGAGCFSEDDARRYTMGGEAMAQEATERRTITDEEYRQLARKKWQDEGECEIDRNAVVSVSEDNGAYVQAWVWVDDPPETEEEALGPAVLC
jgi:hypothetical protein